MKVIILEDIKDFAKKYDIREVKNGYARNFLIPKKLAKLASQNALKELEIKKAEWEKKEEEVKNELRAVADELSKKEIIFELKTGKKDEVFGSVTKDDIKDKLSLDEGEVKLDKPLKIFGEHKVEIDLSKGVKTKVKVVIKPAI